MEWKIMSMVPPLRTAVGRLVILLFLICELSGSVGLPFSDLDVLSLIDPIQQFEEESEAKKVVVKSVFNVPIKAEPSVPPCPVGTRRVTENGSCVPKVSGIKLDDQFLLQSFTNFNRRRPTSLPTPPTHYHGKRRRITTTTPRYEPVPTYVIEEEKIDSDGSHSQSQPLTPIFNGRPQQHTGHSHSHNSYGTTSTTPSSNIGLESIIFPTTQRTISSTQALKSEPKRTLTTESENSVTTVLPIQTTNYEVEFQSHVLQSNDTLPNSSNIPTPTENEPHVPTTPASNSDKEFTNPPEESTIDVDLTKLVFEDEEVSTLPVVSEFEETDPSSETTLRAQVFHTTGTPILSSTRYQSQIIFQDELPFVHVSDPDNIIIFPTNDPEEESTYPVTTPIVFRD